MIVINSALFIIFLPLYGYSDYFSGLRQQGLVADEDAEQGDALLDRQLDDDRGLERFRRVLPELCYSFIKLKI